MRSKIFHTLFFAILTFFIIVPATLLGAVDVYGLTPPCYNCNTSTSINPQNYGQTHSYSALLRGNGEAVVWATVQITNGADSTVSQVVFQTGSIDPRLFEVWQEATSAQARCRNYLGQELTVQDEQSCYQMGSGSYVYYPSTGSYQYTKLTAQQSGKTATITLASPIQKNSTGTLIINYRGFGAVKKSLFGKMTFDLQTLESNDRIRSARVVVDADTDLYIKGDKAKISYVQEAPSSFGKSGGAALENSLSTGLSAQPISDSIGNYYSSNSITKTTIDLLAGDVFHVRGVYATSQLGMYWTSVVWFLLIIAIIVLGIIYGRKYWSKIRPPKSPSVSSSSTTKGSVSDSADWMKFMQSIWGAMIMGFLNAVLVTLLTFVIPWVWETFQGFYRNSYSSDFMNVGFQLLIPLVSVLLFGAALFAPSIYFGQKYGRNYGFILFASMLVSLVILLFVFAAFFSSSSIPVFD